MSVCLLLFVCWWRSCVCVCVCCIKLSWILYTQINTHHIILYFMIPSFIVCVRFMSTPILFMHVIFRFCVCLFERLLHLLCKQMVPFRRFGPKYFAGEPWAILSCRKGQHCSKSSVEIYCSYFIRLKKERELKRNRHHHAFCME